MMAVVFNSHFCVARERFIYHFVPFPKFFFELVNVSHSICLLN